MVDVLVSIYTLKYVKRILIEVVQTGIGEGISLVYYYSNKISIGFDSLSRKEESSGISTSGTQNWEWKREQSTSLTFSSSINSGSSSKIIPNNF